MAKTDLQQMPYGTWASPRKVRMSNSKKKKNPEFEAYQTQLKSREGVVLEIYKDNQGVLHGGVGHKLTEAEKEQYELGDPVSSEQSDAWLKKDSEEAWKSAGKKAKEIGDSKLQSILAPLDFQLGTNWHKDHKKTWSLLQKGDYMEAANEVENSKWFEQSPTRVKDFQQGMYGAAGMLRQDGTVKSAQGYLGPLTNKLDGSTMTEFSTDMEVDGRNINIPTLVPTQSEEALEYITNMKPGQGFNLDIDIEKEIVDVAREHAMRRLQQDRNPFYQDDEEEITLGTSSVINGN